jgi:capsular polysaccharide biosynthesis protein
MVSPDLGRSGGFFERSLYATESLRSLVKGLPFKNRKLFISREDAKIRRLLVEADVVELLSRYGFEVVTLTGMSFVDQMQLFASASVVVSMHGAGLSNIAFMPPSGLVVELLAPDRLWPTYRGIAARAGLHYSPYVGRRAGNIVDRDSDLDVDLHHFVDFVVRSMDAVQSS